MFDTVKMHLAELTSMGGVSRVAIVKSRHAKMQNHIGIKHYVFIGTKFYNFLIPLHHLLLLFCGDLFRNLFVPL